MSLQTEPTSTARRIGLDWLRFFAMVAVSWFHFYENVFWSDATLFRWGESVLFDFIVTYARSLSVSGFIIIALTSFLMARTDSLNRLRQRHYILFGLLLTGAFLVLPLYAGNGEYWLEWDIYHLLLANFLLLLCLRKTSLFLLGWFGLCGFILLWLPVWRLSEGVFGDPFWRQVLVGECSGQQAGPWPLLPWSGLIWFSFYCGQVARKHEAIFRRLHKIEIVYLPLLALATTQWGVYYSTPIGESFYCYMNRQAPIVFWGHFIWILAIIRLSLVENVNSFLNSNRILKSVSRLQWSKNFGFCYLVQLVVILAFSQFESYFRGSAHATAVAMFSVMPLTELIVRGFIGSRCTIGRDRSASRSSFQ